MKYSLALALIAVAVYIPKAIVNAEPAYYEYPSCKPDCLQNRGGCPNNVPCHQIADAVYRIESSDNCYLALSTCWGCLKDNRVVGNVAVGGIHLEQVACPFTPIAGPTPAPTAMPSPFFPTAETTVAPTDIPTKAPSLSLIAGPTVKPSPAPLMSPTHHPTEEPTNNPTPAPTNDPSESPTGFPTPEPTFKPTFHPTPSPTNDPTHAPSMSPTHHPMNFPTTDPTKEPTISPHCNTAFCDLCNAKLSNRHGYHCPLGYDDAQQANGYSAALPLMTQVIDNWNITLFSLNWSYSLIDADKSTFNAFFAESCVVKRECPNCDDGYKVIYYKRIAGDCDSFDAYQVLTNRWTGGMDENGNGNTLNKDFLLTNDESVARDINIQSLGQCNGKCWASCRSAWLQCSPAWTSCPPGKESFGTCRLWNFYCDISPFCKSVRWSVL